jgi:transposase, IS30 family
MSKQHYTHLSFDVRCHIFALKERGISIFCISKQVGYHRSTIYRELKRGENPVLKVPHYQASYAMRRYKKLRKSKQISQKFCGDIEKYVLEKLYLGWSPAQISGRICIDMPGFSISCETIYRHIWSNKKRGGKLYKQLRHAGKKYHKRTHQKENRGIIGRVDIDERSDIVEKKQRIGDWEADLVIGKIDEKMALVTVVDRASKLTKIGFVRGKETFGVCGEIINLLKNVPHPVHTITFDNGREFASHAKIATNLNAKTYFAKPYHSWERGLNEHTNGLIREYFPKKQSFQSISLENIKNVENLLNNRPRKVLGYRTPNEVFYHGFPTHHDVALQT